MALLIWAHTDGLLKLDIRVPLNKRCKKNLRLRCVAQMANVWAWMQEARVDAGSCPWEHLGMTQFTISPISAIEGMQSFYKTLSPKFSWKRSPNTHKFCKKINNVLITLKYCLALSLGIITKISGVTWKDKGGEAEQNPCTITNITSLTHMFYVNFHLKNAILLYVCYIYVLPINIHMWSDHLSSLIRKTNLHSFEGI